ncbi:hypothetical protein Ancab_035907 [Ancistrocladus abbreviatus]
MAKYSASAMAWALVQRDDVYSQWSYLLEQKELLVMQYGSFISPKMGTLSVGGIGRFSERSQEEVVSHH